MKKTILTLLLNFTTLFIFSQKEEFYVNDDLIYISKTDFEKKTDYLLEYNLRFDLDSCFLNVKVSRYKKGKIELNILDSIKTSLSKSSQKVFKSNDIILINYYPGDDACSSNGYKENFKNKQKEYYRKIEKIENIKQFFIYKSDEDLKRFGGKINWLPDENNLIEKVFYPIHYPCGGYVIIDNKGNYLSQRGEYCYSNILIEEIKNFINNGTVIQLSKK